MKCVYCGEFAIDWKGSDLCLNCNAPLEESRRHSSLRIHRLHPPVAHNFTLTVKALDNFSSAMEEMSKTIDEAFLPALKQMADGVVTHGA